MAVKFTRRSTVVARPDYEPPGLLRGLRRWSPQKRLNLIYLGVACFALLLFFYHSFAGPAQFRGQPLLYDEGVVFEKSVNRTAGDAYVLSIEVTLASGRTSSSLVRTDAETWKRLDKGDRVAIVYQTNRAKTKVRVREVGRVALPQPIR